MDAKNFLSEYFKEFQQATKGNGIFSNIAGLHSAILQVKENKCKIMFAGNGASASIASHFALDFTKQGNVCSMAFNDASLITAYGNDYGYENWVGKAVEHYGNEGDLAILISSSGRSPNIVNAAGAAKGIGITVATFTGFAQDNPLKSSGDINLWADSRAYNIVESVHAFWLAATCDLLIGKSEYGVT